MPEYLAPGVYVEEIDTGSKPIEGVSTSTAGFVGMTRRGPFVGLPVLVTSFSDFQRNFGGYFDAGATFVGYNFLPYAVEGFFSNGGKRLYVMRVKPATATKATTNALGGLVTRLSDDALVGQTKLKTITLRGIQAGTQLLLRMTKQGTSTDSNTVTVSSIDPATGEITVSANLTGAGISAFEARYTTVFTNTGGLSAAGAVTTLGSPTAARPGTFTFSAGDEGSWGREIEIQPFHESAGRAQLDAFVSGGVDDNKVRLKSTAGFYANAWVEVNRGTNKEYYRVKAVDGLVLTLYGPAALTAANFAAQLAAPNNIVWFSTCEFRLVISYGRVSERIDGLTLENVPGRYYVDQINARSTLISASAPPPPTATHPFFYPSASDGLRLVLDTAGIDGTAAPTNAEFMGVDNGPGLRTGIKALEDIDQISIIAAPGITTLPVQNTLIEQCTRLMDRFAVLDPLYSLNNSLNDIQNQRKNFDTKYAALYFPRVLVYDPTTDTDIPVPPSGHVVGIYARSDIERGVHKAPANEVVLGITDLEVSLNKAEQDILNPENINVIRNFRAAGRGLRVWGARVMTSDSDWKYVNVRRLFIFLEESLDEGTQWVVFEPNDERLWARVIQSVSNFLTRVWRDGALMGTKPEEAFFVKCDRSTMTQDDIDNGRLIMIIGVAPVKPAEFVIIRIGQWAGGSAVEEG